MRSRKEVTDKLIASNEGARFGRHFYLALALGYLSQTSIFLHESFENVNMPGASVFALRELAKFLPVGTVACIETFFRQVVRELIDFGEPYALRVNKLIDRDHSKPDFSTFWAVHQKKFTLGDFVSHVIPLQDFDSINSTMSTLLAEDFLERIKKTQLVSTKWADYIPRNLKQIGQNAGTIFTDIKELIRIRHVVAHEAHTMFVNEHVFTTISAGFEAACIFLIATHLHVWALLHPGYTEEPTTQVEMNEYAEQAYVETQRRLNATVMEYKTYLRHGRLQEFEDLQVCWNKYAEQAADFAANHYKGGTIMPAIYYSTKKEVTEQRFQEVQRELEERKRMGHPVSFGEGKSRQMAERAARSKKD